MSQQQNLFDPVPRHKLESLSQEEMIEFIEAQQRVIGTFEREVDRLRALNNELEQKVLNIDEQFVTVKNKMFGKSSEKKPSGEDRRKNLNRQKRKKVKVQLPSLRYPNAPLIERDVEFQELPACKCCGEQMQDSGMTENSEYLTKVPAQFIVIRQKRHKYRCGGCHGDLVTAPAPKRIKPGSGYSDEMIIDVAMSKYCDLIPIERYTKIAEREGILDLPPQSLIEQTHHLADFVEGAYIGIQDEVLYSKVLHADETPHRMLEDNDEKKSWYLWGFSTRVASFFEIHNTRSGDVASQLLADSNCEYLISDVYSGYAKSVRETNKARESNGQPLIKNIYCNAHARRKFKQAEKFPDEAAFFLDIYGKLYRLEDIAQARPPDRILRVRRLMKPLFEKLRDQALQSVGGYSSKSKIAVAMNYFLKNYHELTAFTDHAELPIDNNHQERQFRSPVVGRKTWYGTHSKRGARTTAILFSLVESCKLNKVNPREYFKDLVSALQQGEEAFTPHEYLDRQGTTPSNPEGR